LSENECFNPFSFWVILQAPVSSLIIYVIRLPTFKIGESKHISKHVEQFAVLNMAELVKESNKHVSNRSIN
jgi:hypothetical protein